MFIKVTLESDVNGGSTSTMECHVVNPRQTMVHGVQTGPRQALKVENGVLKL